MLEVDVAMRNFPTKLWKRFQDYKEAPAVYTVDDGQREVLSYWAWTRRIQNLAMAMMDRGFKTGMRMGFVAPNSRDWLDLAIATWLVGGCVVPLVPDSPRKETLRGLGRSGCDWIVVADANARTRLRGPGGKMPPHLQWIYVDGEPTSEDTHGVGELEKSGRGLVRRGHTKKLAKRIYELDADAPTLILFDSEISEDSQGAFFTGTTVDLQLEAIVAQMGLPDDAEVVLATVQSFGRFSSLLLALATLYAGHAVALAPTRQRLDDHFETLLPTHLVCGADYLKELADRWQQRLDDAPDFLKKIVDTGEESPSWTRVLGSVGEKAARKFLYDPIRREFGGKLEAIHVFEGRCPVGLHPVLDGADIALLGHFGVPEAGITHVEHPEARRPDSAGRPIEGVATKIDGAKMGEVGELCVRGETIFEEYWAGQGPRKVDDEGWLHTGRQARLESGFLFLEDLEC